MFIIQIANLLRIDAQDKQVAWSDKNENVFII